MEFFFSLYGHGCGEKQLRRCAVSDTKFDKEETETHFLKPREKTGEDDCN